jgi:thioredoxin 1
LDKETYPNPKVVGLASKFIPVKLDAGKEGPAKIAQSYRVEAVPTILFVDAKGKTLHQFVGYRSPDDFTKEMKTALTKAKK